MSPYQKNQKDKRRKNLFRKWHRRVGFTAAIFLVNLAVTGILLNHSDDLALHNKYIESDWIIELYGIKSPERALCIEKEINYQNICQLGEKIYFGKNMLIDHSENLTGLVELDDIIYLSTSEKLFLYTKEMQLVETFDKDSTLPTPIDQIFKSNDTQSTPILETLTISSNEKIWYLNQNSMLWYNSETGMIKTSKLNLTKIEITALTELEQVYLDHQITLLKFIQDLHSGRIFSLPGKILTDLIGIIIILLVVSGYFAWQRRKEKR